MPVTSNLLNLRDQKGTSYERDQRLSNPDKRLSLINNEVASIFSLSLATKKENGHIHHWQLMGCFDKINNYVKLK